MPTDVLKEPVQIHIEPWAQLERCELEEVNRVYS